MEFKEEKTKGFKDEMNEFSKYLITFEGNDGSGKGTQIEKAFEFIKKTVKELDIDVNNVVKTFEPGGTYISDKIREIILLNTKEYERKYNIENEVMDSRAELLLYLSSRAQHTTNVLIPHLKNKDIVICSRYADSSFAYQGFGREINKIIDVNFLNNFATYGLIPGLTIYLYLEDVYTGIQRKLNQKSELDRLELEDAKFILRVKEGFETLSESYPERIKPVNASKDFKYVQEEIEILLKDYLIRNFKK
ncbi:MAG TPA: dTMP kinase [Candidatus Woesearchaeota archaeon]|nr:dTMP kinase [Candidatus Woesearchaeota archaeon]